MKRKNKGNSFDADQLFLNILNSKLLVSFLMTESRGLMSFSSRVYSMPSLHETQMIFGHKLFSFLALQDCISYRVAALVSLMEAIRNTQENKRLGCGIFIDLQKAFHTVNYNILLSKMEHYDIRGCALEWFK